MRLAELLRSAIDRVKQQGPIQALLSYHELRTTPDTRMMKDFLIHGVTEKEIKTRLRAVRLIQRVSKRSYKCNEFMETYK